MSDPKKGSPSSPPAPASDPPASADHSDRSLDHGPDRGLNGAGGSEHEAEPASERARLTLEAPPEQVLELYAACLRFVASKYKVSLDGAPETLSLLDQYVREAREAVRERPESIDVVAPAVGAYLGEVMRRQFGAEWWAEGEYDAWRLYFTNVYLAFNPLGMAREAITMTDEEGWGAHLVLDPSEREEIEARLQAMPEVEEDEYYLPTTRFDVIAGIVETLRARAEEAGTGDVMFSKDDYS